MRYESYLISYLISDIFRARWSLDAFSHFYNRVCPSVGPSVGLSVRPSVGDAFFKNNQNQCFFNNWNPGKAKKTQIISLDASLHLYKRVSLSVGQSVCQSDNRLSARQNLSFLWCWDPDWPMGWCWQHFCTEEYAKRARIWGVTLYWIVVKTMSYGEFHF